MFLQLFLQYFGAKLIIILFPVLILLNIGSIPLSVLALLYQIILFLFFELLVPNFKIDILTQPIQLIHGFSVDCLYPLILLLQVDLLLRIEHFLLNLLFPGAILLHYFIGLLLYYLVDGVFLQLLNIDFLNQVFHFLYMFILLFLLLLH